MIELLLEIISDTKQGSFTKVQCRLRMITQDDVIINTKIENMFPPEYKDHSHPVRLTVAIHLTWKPNAIFQQQGDCVWP